MKLKLNKKYKITGEISDFKLGRRLCELGFVIGETIEIKQCSLFRRTYLVVCRNATMSISKNILLQLRLINE